MCIFDESLCRVILSDEKLRNGGHILGLNRIAKIGFLE